MSKTHDPPTCPYYKVQVTIGSHFEIWGGSGRPRAKLGKLRVGGVGEVNIFGYLFGPN